MNLNVSNSGYKPPPCILPVNSDYSFYTRLDGIQYFEIKHISMSTVVGSPQTFYGEYNTYSLQNTDNKW